MSEQETNEIDPIFAEAMEFVSSLDNGTSADNNPEPTPETGQEAAGTAAGVESSGAEPQEPAGAPSADVLAAAAALAEPGSVPGAAGEGAPVDSAAASGATQNSGSVAGGVSRTDSDAAFDAATRGLQESFEERAREAAINTIREELAPEFLSALNSTPYQLQGREVPSLRGNDPNEMITLRNTEEARDWQEALKQTISNEVNQQARANFEAQSTFRSTVQDNITLFQRNPELLPASSEYNPELLSRLMNMAGAYLQKDDNGKFYGFGVDVQPLIDAIKKDLAAKPAAPTPQQVRASEQPRTPAGRFDAPQAGVPSRNNGSGAEPPEDYSAFWEAVGLPSTSL